MGATAASERRLTAYAALVAGASLPALLVLQYLADARGLAEAQNDPATAALFASQNPILSALFPATTVAMDLAALMVVISLQPALASVSRVVAGTGAALGVFWISTDLIQGLLRFLPYSGSVPVEQTPAMALMAQAIWHAGRLGAGLWILSVAACNRDPRGTAFRLVSLAVGVLLAGHPFLGGRWAGWSVLEFVGLTGWFVWLGVSLLRHHEHLGDAGEPTQSVPRTD
jgi:hypothetical protein